MTTAVTVKQQGLTAPREPTALLADFAAWLRLGVAEGDAKPNTIRTYQAQAGQFVAWCQDQGIQAAQADGGDILAYRRYLVEAGYTRGTVALKLGVVRRLYEAAAWRGLRVDNPAAGVKAPKDKTAKQERVKFLPLDGLRHLLAAPQGDGAQERRDRAILHMMGIQGLRVAEVAGLQVGSLDLDAGRARVVGKGDKTRTIYLVPPTMAALSDWLQVREPGPGVAALFVVVGPRGTGQPLGDRAIRCLVDGYLDGLGLKAEGVSCHALRHSAATWAKAGGASIDALADMLGHASVDTARIYAKIVDQINENPARYLAELLGS